MTLNRYPLYTLAGHEPGRQVKLGPALDDARPIMTPTAPADVLDTLKAHGYTGTVDQVLTHSARFPVTIPEGTRGIVEGVDTDGRWAIVAFVWKTPKSGKITAAMVQVEPAHLLNHRGAPPLPGEPRPGSATTSTATAPATQEPPMLQTLTATNPAPAPAAAGSLDALLAAVVDARVGARIAALEAELASRPAGAAVHHVRINEGAPVTLSRRPHARFASILSRAKMTKPDGTRFNLFLTGDAGTGKSTIAASIAEALGLRLFSINCSGGMTEGQLVGRMTPNLSTGEMVYTPGPLVEAYRDGGVFLLDELDAADENVLLAINTLMDAPRWFAPDGTAIDRSPNFYLLGAGNTYGTGANRTYNGRNQLDGAFLDRWLTVAVDYDVELERSLVACAEIAERIQSARVRIRERNLRRWLTTRALLKADALVGQLGLSVAEAIREVTEGWTAEDRAVAGL